MESVSIDLLKTFAAALIGGLVSYLLQRQKIRHELQLLREEHKTEFMAESTARHFLNHQGYTDRSFETLKNHLGGFEDDELRKILVRAGAIRVYRKDGTEWWRLLERMGEYIEHQKAKDHEQEED